MSIFKSILMLKSELIMEYSGIKHIFNSLPTPILPISTIFYPILHSPDSTRSHIIIYYRHSCLHAIGVGGWWVLWKLIELGYFANIWSFAAVLDMNRYIWKKHFAHFESLSSEWFFIFKRTKMKTVLVAWRHLKWFSEPSIVVSYSDLLFYSDPGMNPKFILILSFIYCLLLL